MANKKSSQTLSSLNLSTIQRRDVLMIDPKDLILIVDSNSPLYDPRAVETPLDMDLVDSIRRNGVLQPIVVRKDGNQYQVIAGRNRVRACRFLRENEESDVRVPCISRTGSDKDMVLLAMEENVRVPETLNSRAVKVRNAFNQGASKTEIASALHCTVYVVDDHMTFLSLDPKVQAAFETRALPVGAISSFADVPKSKQVSLLEKLQKNGIKKRHEIKAAVEADAKDEDYVAPDFKKAMARSRLEKWEFYLGELQQLDGQTVGSPRDIEVARAMLRRILGYADALASMGHLSPPDELVFKKGEPKVEAKSSTVSAIPARERPRFSEPS